jgi:hypothetical protein
MWIAYVVTSQDRLLDGSFEKFVNSIQSQFKSVRIVAGLRDCALPDQLRSAIHLEISLPLKISLSKARNALLDAYAPTENDWVCFPDDDCWYPSNLLSTVVRQAHEKDFILGVIDTGKKNLPSLPNPEPLGTMNLQDALKHTASAALFIDGKSFRNFRFDERLGLGAKVGSAEDLDLVLFLLQQGCQGVYSTDIRVLHPYKPQRETEYFEGSIAVLSKYFGKIPFCRYSAGRRMAKGILLVLKRKLPVSQLLKGISYASKKW